METIQLLLLYNLSSNFNYTLYGILQYNTKLGWLRCFVIAVYRRGQNAEWTSVDKKDRQLVHKCITFDIFKKKNWRCEKDSIIILLKGSIVVPYIP